MIWAESIYILGCQPICYERNTYIISIMGPCATSVDIYISPADGPICNMPLSVKIMSPLIAVKNDWRRCDAVFSISITPLYVAYSIPIAARWIWRKENGWMPGTFSLGAWVSVPIVLFSDTRWRVENLNVDRVDSARLFPSAGWC